MASNPYPNFHGKIAWVKFITPLVLAQDIEAVKIADGREADFVLLRPFAIRYSVGSRIFTLETPAGLITDLPSIPKAARSLISKVGPQLWAAIPHDDLYTRWQVIGHKPTKRDRKFADDLFLACLKEAGVGWFKRQTMYRMVRAFGSGPFFKRDDRVIMPKQELVERFVLATDGS